MNLLEELDQLVNDVGEIYHPINTTESYDKRAVKLRSLLVTRVKDLLLRQHVEECDVCHVENGQQIYCNMTTGIRLNLEPNEDVVNFCPSCHGKGYVVVWDNVHGERNGFVQLGRESRGDAT